VGLIRAGRAAELQKALNRYGAAAVKEAAAELGRDITPEQRWLFALCLAQGYADADAAFAVGRSLVRLRRELRADPDFARLVAEAQAEGTAVMEAEATRRAMVGVSEPVYHNGEVVGHRKVYSDSLIQFLLRARDPERFKERRQVEVSGHDLPDRLVEARKRAREQRRQLRDDTVEEAEYREVEGGGDDLGDLLE